MRNIIDEELLLLERPNIREDCNIKNNQEMANYLDVYNAYNNLLIQYMIKEYHLINVDQELEKRMDIIPPVSSEDKDLYQRSSEGYLKYFYLRNNIYIERLTQEQINYLYLLYHSGSIELNAQNKKLIEETYLDVIIEDKNTSNLNINYGPNNSKFYKPANAIIIGVRYNQNEKITGNKNTFLSTEAKIDFISNFLKSKINTEKDIPFYIIKYDDYSTKKKENNTNELSK